MSQQSEFAIFGGGCFWCTEAIFAGLKGVSSVMPGYAGGQTSHPTYEQVCSGATGHAEVIKIEFNPAAISYRDLLEVFFALHDPTTKNQQGNDVGVQYRSVIFAATEEQQRAAEDYLRDLKEQNIFSRPIVTEVISRQPFYAAEDYHRDYFAKNSDQPYCQAVISPKLAKLRQKFSARVK